MIVNPSRFGSAAVVDGTQGSANAGILAAVYFTVSGTTVTVVGQKNVASVTRNATGKYRITFASTLANANYGLIGGGRWSDAANDEAPIVVPTRNTASGFNTYSTATVDVSITTPTGTLSDPLQCGIAIFDPSAVGSDYIAACSVTVSGTTPTLQRQTNVSSIPRQATGVYRANFTSAPASDDYSVFGSTRYPDFANEANPEFGVYRNTTPTTSLIDITTGTLIQGGVSEFATDPGRFSMLARYSDVAPRGTVASARFTVSGGVVTLGKSWNIASVTRQASGLFRLAFTAPISDANYVVMGCGKWPPSAGDPDAPLIGANRNSSSSRNVKSTTAVDIAVRAWGNAGTPFDPEAAAIWILKPWLM